MCDLLLRLWADALPAEGTYPGTLVALVFRQDRVRDFPRLLDQAKRACGLLRSEEERANFSP